VKGSLKPSHTNGSALLPNLPFKKWIKEVKEGEGRDWSAAGDVFGKS
jgi:hypothetical protein